MVGIVIVSHSHFLATGLQDLVKQASSSSVKVAIAGGVDEITIGTNAERIYQAIQEAFSPDGVLIFFDLNNALLSTQIAIEMLPPEKQPKIKVSNAPLVEGAIVAAVEASLGHSLSKVNTAAEAALATPKNNLL